MCSALTGRKGVLALRRAIEDSDSRSESPGETLSRELVHRLCIEPPELQVVVWSAEGQHRLDLAWRVKKVALALGWTFIRVEWKHLFREQEFKMTVLQALRSKSAA